MRWKSIFLFVFVLLLGAYLGRSVFPTRIIQTEYREVLTEAPPEVLERVVVDTVQTFVTRWKTRVLYKTLRPERILEIPHFELPVFNWAILSATKEGKRLIIDLYNVPDSSLFVYEYSVKDDWQLRIIQGRAADPLVLREKRDLIDVIPGVYLGYGRRSGPSLRLRQRFWRLWVDYRADTDGLDVEGYVRLW